MLRIKIKVEVKIKIEQTACVILMSLTSCNIARYAEVIRLLPNCIEGRLQLNNIVSQLTLEYATLDRVRPPTDSSRVQGNSDLRMMQLFYSST